ncbi:MAG: pyruvate kinase [Candidatus Woesearchaeota archaeon]
MHKHTKIIVTIGPASDSVDTIRKLYEAGMNVARLNFSHGDHNYFSKVISNIRKVSKEIGILLDTKGPEIRTGKSFLPIRLIEGNEMTLTNKGEFCNDKTLVVKYPKIDNLNIGDELLIDDGLILVRVVSKENGILRVKIIEGGELSSNKSVTIKGHNVELPFLSMQDKKDVKFGMRMGVDFIAASFVRSKKDIVHLRKFVGNSKLMLISKIEHWKAIENLDQIISESDGIMIARGDLGVEISLERVPKLQHEIIQKCNDLAKPVIVATQMLESMRNNLRPTRAEVSDVAQAILQGADAVMLSGETTIGKYPVQAVQMMARIAREYDHRVDTKISKRLSSSSINEKIAQFVTEAAFFASKNLGVKAILTPTETGFTARHVSRFKPRCPILALTRSMSVFRQLQISWGVHPVAESERITKLDDMIKYLVRVSFKKGFVEKEDVVLVTAGHKLHQKGHTNLLEIHKVDDVLSGRVSHR